MEKQEQNSICREIGARTGGDIYIGVVGPVRSGKSTFIKRFMEQLVLPAMSGSAAARERARPFYFLPFHRYEIFKNHFYLQQSPNFHKLGLCLSAKDLYLCRKLL